MIAPAFWTEMLGLAAAVLTTSSYLPQVIKIWRSGHARDVSLIMYLMMTLGISLWLTYGLLLHSLALIVANSSALTLTLSVLVLKAKDMHRHKRRQDDRKVHPGRS